MTDFSNAIGTSPRSTNSENSQDSVAEPEPTASTDQSPIADGSADEPGIQRALKFGTVVGAAVVLIGYLLPWADIVGPTLPAEEVPVAVEDLLISGSEDGQLGASEIALFPELTVVIAILAAAIALLRWNSIIQAMTGLLGLTGTGVMMYIWAILATDDEIQIAIGDRVGFASSFEPAIGIWVALSGAFLIAICGFVSVLYGYLSER